MRALFDSSSLISLAWSGLLPLLERIPVEPVVTSGVYEETVTRGLALGYPDAKAIESALRDAQRLPDPAAATVDEQVVAAARTIGVVVANDLVIGRRASNAGVRWLRSADLVVVAGTLGALDRTECTAGLAALLAAGRITPALHAAYLERL